MSGISRIRGAAVPLVTFGLAVLVSSLFGLRGQALALRASSATTHCIHEKFSTPWTANATATRVDQGQTLLTPPSAGDMALLPPAAYAHSLNSVTQNQDASLAIHLGRKGGEDFSGDARREGESAGAYGLARSGFTLDGAPASCCHTARFETHGAFRARLAVVGPIDLGSSGRALVGVPMAAGDDVPIRIETNLTFDLNCNGVLDHYYHRVDSALRLRAWKDTPGRPARAIFVGFQQGRVQEITDGTGIQYGPRRTIYVSSGALPDDTGVEETVTRPTGFTNQSRKFRERAANFVQANLDASVEVRRVVLFRDYPKTEVDLTFDSERHFVEDQDESKQVEIKKSF